MRAANSLLLLGAVLVLATLGSAERKEPILGGWTQIKNMSDPHVAEIGGFAVSEHNKESNSKLALSRVIECQTQVVAGTNYKLLLEAKDGGDKAARYEAVVWEKAWEKFLKLTSFKPVKN